MKCTRRSGYNNTFKILEDAAGDVTLTKSALNKISKETMDRFNESKTVTIKALKTDIKCSKCKDCAGCTIHSATYMITFCASHGSIYQDWVELQADYWLSLLDST
jgi:hypothetical protein